MYMEKREDNGYFENYCSLRPETWQMETTYEVNKGVLVFKVNVISRTKCFKIRLQVSLLMTNGPLVGNFCYSFRSEGYSIFART